MTAERVDIDLDGDTVSIVTSAHFGLVLLEAARRDLNAMSQALGAGNDLRNRYAGYARTLSEAATSIPRVDLPTGKVAGPKPIPAELEWSFEREMASAIGADDDLVIAAVQRQRDSTAGQSAMVGSTLRPSDLDEGQPLRQQVDELWDDLVKRQSDSRLHREHTQPDVFDADLEELLG